MTISDIDKLYVIAVEDRSVFATSSWAELKQQTDWLSDSNLEFKVYIVKANLHIIQQLRFGPGDE
jgi:peroxiredoxin